MRIHHLNCGTLCPVGQRLVDGSGTLFARGRLVCHCLLIETNGGLVLVDSGLGLDDIGSRGKRTGRFFPLLSGATLDIEETAVRQVVRLGFRATDVTHIILTHLDVDHAGGIADFPNATVHVSSSEHAAAMGAQGFGDSQRYRPVNWSHQPKWALHETAGERWMGFDAVHALEKTASLEVLLVPLVGHSRGHCGVAVRGANNWLLHCGDAYYFHGEMDLNRPVCPPALSAFSRFLQADRALRLTNLERLRELKRTHSEIELFCGHDAVEFDSFQSINQPRAG
ncbi:MAG: MBL fold metallo-hydrolase [Myxococcales bacterium]|nr:MBL fold metallo-hydrolase [Myxococcales bacterium]